MTHEVFHLAVLSDTDSCSTVARRIAAEKMEVAGENIVALCDMNARHLDAAAKKFPGAAEVSLTQLQLVHTHCDSSRACAARGTNTAIAATRRRR